MCAILDSPTHFSHALLTPTLLHIQPDVCDSLEWATFQVPSVSVSIKWVRLAISMAQGLYHIDRHHQDRAVKARVCNE